MYSITNGTQCRYWVNGDLHTYIGSFNGVSSEILCHWVQMNHWLSQWIIIGSNVWVSHVHWWLLMAPKKIDENDIFQETEYPGLIFSSMTQIWSKKGFLTFASWSNLPNSSLRSLTNSCAEHWDESSVNPAMSAKRILQS
jgi:hypothetical protein